MDFQTGITPLVFKSIQEHNKLCLDNLNEVIHDMRYISGKQHPITTLSDAELRRIIRCAFIVASDWATERRVLSKHE